MEKKNDFKNDLERINYIEAIMMDDYLKGGDDDVMGEIEKIGKLMEEIGFDVEKYIK